MKCTIFKGLSIAAIAAAAGQGAWAADAYDDTGAVYLAPMAQYTFLDSKRISNDEFGYQVGLGYNFAPNFAAELAFSPGSFPIKSGYYQGASEKLFASSLDVLYKFMPMTSTFRPYLLVGTGVMTDNIGRQSINYQQWMAEGGAGMLIGLGDQTGSSRLQLRAEAKYRYELAYNIPYVPKDPGDVLVSAGFQFMFGAPIKPAVVVAPPPPPPPPAPPPPPPPPPPPLDSDGDGVPDSIDRCPNTPKGDVVDQWGCTIKLERVHFATDKAVILPESDEVLDQAVAVLKEHPNLVIEVDGHTDSTGSPAHNLDLSQRRADSVVQYLRTHGVTNTMTAKGYGEEKPIADNATKDGRALNRRVGLHIVGGTS
jgi:OmpA-OmpF porin, OOP family